MADIISIPLDLGACVPDGCPSFDEWFLHRHRASFDQMYFWEGARIDLAMRALSVALRDYTTEMVRISLRR